MLPNLLLNNFILISCFYHYPQTHLPESEPLAREDEKVLDSFFCSKYFKRVRLSYSSNFSHIRHLLMQKK